METLSFEGLFALLPVAGAEFVGLQRIQNTKNFLRIASDGKIVDGNKADDVLGIDDEGGALSDAFLRIENAQLFAEFALNIGQHRERKVFQIFMVGAPGKVHKLGIGAAAQNLRVAIVEIAI